VAQDQRALQTAIEAGLRRLSAVDLQKLAEQLALVLRPDIFNASTLVVRGRNIEDQTTKGWPDAYAEAPNGRLYAIEATRQKSSWASHIAEDYEKGCGAVGRKLAGYFFVGGYPDHSVTDEELSSWKTKFQALGIEARDIAILVGIHLVTALLRAECARIRETILHISAPTRFRLLRLGAAQLAHNAWQPTLEDFENNRVFAPAIMLDMIRALELDGVALVRGHGAAGKTTLIELLAIHPQIVPFPLFYADIIAAEENSDLFRSDVINEFAALAGPGVIFALDNIHLAEGLVEELFIEWRATSRSMSSRLVLLGRERRSNIGTSVSGILPLMLRARGPELRGVVRRLLERAGRAVPPISESQADEWLATFGGPPDEPYTSADLIAFSAAVANRLTPLAAGDLTLRETDAVEGVRARYLNVLADHCERANLLRIAATEIVEVPCPDACLPHPEKGFPVCNLEGLVLSDWIGMERRKQHRLAHPALGALLTTAAGMRDRGEGERLTAGSQSAALGLRLASQAPTKSERTKLERLVAELEIDGSWIVSCYSLQDIVTVARWLVATRTLPSQQVDDALAESPYFEQLLTDARSADSWLPLLNTVHNRGLTRVTAQTVRLAEAPKHVRMLVSMIGATRCHTATFFLKAHPAGSAILAAIDADAWNTTQSRFAPIAWATQTVGAIRYFERHGRPELARGPADAIVLRADARQWIHADMAHLSHILRTCGIGAEEERAVAIRLMMQQLSLSSWLARAIAETHVGDLSGALLSLSNHLTDELLQLLPSLDIASRVQRQLLSAPMDEASEPTVRAIALFGSAAEILPSLDAPTNLRWPTSETLERLVASRVRKDMAGQLGTHEIQLWLGLMRVALHRGDSVQVSADQRARVKRLLRGTSAPTARAASTRERLLRWLDA
jgi:hypothetical protein